MIRGPIWFLREFDRTVITFYMVLLEYLHNMMFISKLMGMNLDM